MESESVRVVATRGETVPRSETEDERTLTGSHSLEGGSDTQSVLSRFDDEGKTRVDVVTRGLLGLLDGDHVS